MTDNIAKRPAKNKKYKTAKHEVTHTHGAWATFDGEKLVDVFMTRKKARESDTGVVKKVSVTL